MPAQAAPSRDAVPSRAAASAPIKTREEVLEAVKSGAFPLKDNERDSLRNRSTPLCGSPVRSLYTLFILPLALTRIVLFIVVFTSTGCTAALAACLPARSCGRRCLLAIAMRGNARNSNLQACIGFGSGRLYGGGPRLCFESGGV